MESECFQTYKSLVSEVTKGMEQVKQLGASSSGNNRTVLERMLASYEEALSILQGRAPEGQCQSVMTSLSDPNSSVSVCTRMESECFQTYKSLVSEVTKGMEQVKQLGASSSGNNRTVLERMLASYEEALSILQGRAPEGQCQSVMTSLSDPNSSVSVCKVTQSESSRGSEKRKFFEVNVTSDGLPEAPDDGCSSRKDSQIDVHDLKKPRMTAVTAPTRIHKTAVHSETGFEQHDDGYK